MDKEKIYKLYKDKYTKKQIDDILNGGEVADVWGEKEKKVKKTGKESKKDYNIKDLRFNEKRGGKV